MLTRTHRKGSGAWADALDRALADPSETSLLALAEKAERAAPGDPHILCQAALAALIDARPDRAQIYLKRYAKRYAPSDTHHLLSALTLAAQNRQILARALLERHYLSEWPQAMRAFPGGWPRRPWLSDRLDAIMGARAAGPAAARRRR